MTTEKADPTPITDSLLAQSEMRTRGDFDAMVELARSFERQLAAFARMPEGD